MPEKQHITLQLDCHSIGLTVDREAEPMYREAGQRLNQKFEQYKRQYPHLSAEQVWAYVALAMAVNFQSDVREKNIQPIIEKIKELNILIQENLN